MQPAPGLGRPIGSRVECLSLLAILLLAVPGTVRAQYAGGSGTAEDPFLVATAEHLDAMRQNLAAHFLLIDDIDLGSTLWSEGEGWEPIGTSTARFRGSFDGGGWSIFHLRVDRPGEMDWGLFGYLDGAIISDLGIVDAGVRGGNYTGLLAGRAVGSAIERVRVSGDVVGGTYTGGVIGSAQGGSLLWSSSESSLAGSGYSGGLVGYGYSSLQVAHSHARGSVSGGNYSGGLVGYLSGATVVDSYSRASVDGGSSSSIGGLLGYIVSSGLHFSYSTGSVIGGSTFGGLVGGVGSNVSVT